MKAKRTFRPDEVLADARAGGLTGAALRKAIEKADEFGNNKVAEQLKLCLVQSSAFAGDAAPAEVRDRVAQGVSALTGMGEPLSHTKQMLKKLGVVETLNRIAKHPDAKKNFDRLYEAGLEHLTAEAIVLDYPDLFSEKAVEVARTRLGR